MRLARTASVTIILFAAYSCGSSSPAAPSPPPATRVISLSGNLAFGNAVVGSTATTTLTIANSGSASLTVTGMTGPSGFTASWTSGVIPAGGSQPVTIGFSPTAVGTYSGTIAVIGDQTSGNNTIAASGTAYPNMNGGWFGTETASASGISAVCNMTSLVSGQTGSSFNGTWQTSGTSCGQAGTLSGVVSLSNTVPSLTFSATVGAPNCTRVAGDGVLSGTLSGNSLLAQATDTIRCQGFADLTRSITVSMTKQ
ncbi:MAG TPA: choice-of-anchor D domain-containing protein [Vicinamibacterales bacterium]|nr:choice-of-anchor D domain-containing protein [Vicinamibacterales bacterium]